MRQRAPGPADEAECSEGGFPVRIVSFAVDDVDDLGLELEREREGGGDGERRGEVGSLRMQ